MNNNTQNPNSKTLTLARISVLLQLFKTLKNQDPKSLLPKSLLLFLLITTPPPSPQTSKTRKPNPDFPKSKKTKSHSPSTQSQSQSQPVDSILPGLPDDLALDCFALSSRSDYPSLSCTNKKLKTLISSGYLYKLRRNINKIEHYIYMASSFMPWTAFDPSRRIWIPMPRIPCDECFNLADKESLAVGTHLLVFGREIYDLVIYKYDVASNHWSTCRPMIHGRCLFGSGSRNELAVLAGGIDITGRVLKSAELYDSDADTWTPLPELNIARRLSAGFFMDGKFYVIGGMDANREWLACGEEFDFSTRVWRRILNMYEVPNNDYHQSPPLVAVVNNNLYLAHKETNVVKKYDKKNNYWVEVNELPVRADSLRGWGIGFKGCGDTLIVIKGKWVNLGQGIAIYGWRPDNEGGEREWEVLGERDRAGDFVTNCAVMGC
ncbi:hypothetical protein LUZ60_009042 [Juncus effusus]|nr:hypothetical protein LUZ60_009042 [Juncus effusus]